MDYSTALQKILDLEGRTVTNITGDKGGVTAYGITQTVYDSYRLGTGQAAQTAADISQAEIDAIYFNNYWMVLNCQNLPDGLDFAVFQAGVNFGTAKAARWLQAIVGVTADGVIGPQTINAVKNFVNQSSVQLLIASFLQTQADHYSEIVAADPSQGKFYNGWMNRIAAVESFIAENPAVASGLGLAAIALIAFALKGGGRG